MSRLNIHGPAKHGRQAEQLRHAPTEDLAALYFTEKLSCIEIASRYDITATAVAARLRRAGYQLRSCRDSQLESAKRRTPSQRMDRVRAAHQRIPLAREERGEFDSPVERRLHGLIKRAGPFTIQKAIGRYSVDMATDSIAVEISGGRWNGRRSSRERTDYILNAGFHVIEIVCDRGHGFHPIAAHQVVAVMDLLKWLPPTIRQYWVIWGSGEFLSSRQMQSDDRPSVTARYATLD